MRLNELNNLQPFKTDEYNTPNQMEIMANPDYWREKKGVVGGVQWMTPTQYIQACEIGFRNNGSEGLVRGGRQPDLIKKYGFDMKRGDKFPMLELDYRNDYFGQEGLHRAMAAEEIGVKKLPVFIMKDAPKEDKDELTEGITPIVYHYMNIRNAESVLRQNKFRLTASPGTEAEKTLQKGDRMYYLSTTRHKLGGYHIDNSMSGVIFELDGNKLSQNYAGKAVDYWGADWYGAPGTQKKGYEKKEAEDRVYSYKPYIKNASKYIKSVHILYDAESQKRHDQLAIDVRRMYIAAKRNGIKPYLYTDKQNWLIQDTRKAVNPTSIPVIAQASGKKKDTQKTYRGGYDRRNLAPWIELYQAPVEATISKKAQDTRYNYVLYGYSDAAQSLAADMHNAKSKPADETGLETLLKIFRKEKIRSPQEYLDLLHKKWAPKDES